MVKSTVNIKAERLNRGGGNMPFSNNFPEKIDVHNYGEKIKNQELLLEKAEIRDDNKQLIKDFITICKADPKVGGSRIRLYLYSLRYIALWAGDKSFKDMDKKDIAELIAKLKEHKFLSKKRLISFNSDCKEKGIVGQEREKPLSELTEKEGRNYSPNSVEDFLKAIKKFWKWLYDTGKEDPPQTKWFCTRMNRSNGEIRIFSKDEIRRLINGCNNIRDKAFFSCLYDLECRVSELLSRQIRHIKYDEDGDIQILVESDKTNKKHWEVLFESAPLLTTWLRSHPCPDDQNAPLWTNARRNGKIKALNYANIRKIFYTVCKTQQIRVNEKTNIHMIRKSKATHDIMDGVPLSVVESRGSWSKGSRALHECYIAVQDEDKKNAYRKKYGIAKKETQSEIIELKRCDRCKAVLENGSKFCANCGFLVDKTLRAKTAEINKDITGLIDKDMLSEMIKKIVLESMDGGKDGKSKETQVS